MTVLVFLSSPVTVLAASDTLKVDHIRHKINLSGRQRMLSQRMAAATCMAASGFDGKSRAEVAWFAHSEFAAALAELQYGNESKNIPAEGDRAILAAFEEVEQVWASVGPAVQQLSSGDLHPVVLRQLLTGNLPLLKASNAVVTQIVARYGGDVIDPESAKTINIAGRQRMLSQKMMKQACFVAADFELEKNKAALVETIALFDRSLVQLRNGDGPSGVMAPPNPDVARQLDYVATLWEEYKLDLSMVNLARAPTQMPCRNWPNNRMLFLWRCTGRCCYMWITIADGVQSRSCA